MDFIGVPGFLVIAIVAVLLYGERLPEVARTFGKQFMTLKKSFQGMREEFEASVHQATSTVTRTIESRDELAEREEATAPKFEPPPCDPVAETH